MTWLQTTGSCSVTYPSSILSQASPGPMCSPKLHHVSPNHRNSAWAIWLQHQMPNISKYNMHSELTHFKTLRFCDYPPDSYLYSNVEHKEHAADTSLPSSRFSHRTLTVISVIPYKASIILLLRMATSRFCPMQRSVAPSESRDTIGAPLSPICFLSIHFFIPFFSYLMSAAVVPSGLVCYSRSTIGTS